MIARTATMEVDAQKGVDSACAASEEAAVWRPKDARYSPDGPFWEHLSCGRGEADLSLANSRGLFCFDHDERAQAGELVRDTWRLDADRKCRGEVRWFPENLSIRDAILDGKRPNNFSVGYTWVAETRRESRADGLHIWLKWKFLEFSYLRSQPPADSEAGLYRCSMNPSLEEMLRFAMSGSRTQPHDDWSDVSLLETIRQLGHPPSGRVAAMHRAMPFIGPNRVSRGVPFSLFDSKTRDMTAGQFASGGAFVATQMEDGVPLLFNTSVCRRLGATVVTGLRENFTKPRIVTAPLASALQEIAPSMVSNLMTDNSELGPKRISVEVILSRQWLLQSGPGAENYIRKLVTSAINVQLDYLALWGNGSQEQPLGIAETPGCQSILFAGVTWAKLLSCEAALSSGNIPITRPGWAVSPAAQLFLKSTPQIVGFPRYLLDGGQINGVQATASNQLSGGNQAVFSTAWDTLCILIWGEGFDMLLDTVTLASSGECRLTCHLWANLLPLYPSAFLVSADTAAA
jgi:hypothetical protein